MSLVRHRLYQKPTWICSDHVSEFSDIFDVRTSQPKPVFLELFSGSGHIAAAASMRGFETITVDIEPRFSPDICIDICNLRRSLLPDRVDVVWASIPCTVYSILNLSNHWTKICIGYRRYHYSPATPEALEALRILTATLRLIRKLKPLYYFIENPQGRPSPHAAHGIRSVSPVCALQRLRFRLSEADGYFHELSALYTYRGEWETLAQRGAWCSGIEGCARAGAGAGRVDWVFDGVPCVFDTWISGGESVRDDKN